MIPEASRASISILWTCDWRVLPSTFNRWIDNIFTLQSHLANKFEGHGDAVKALFKNAGVKEDLDNIP